MDRADARWSARTAVLGLALGWALAAAAQTTGTPIETPPVLLPPEKQALVKQYVARAQPPAARIDQPLEVGTTVPDAVDLFGLPQDTVTEVPAVTRYRFVLTGGSIAVVDPETRKVIQLIPN